MSATVIFGGTGYIGLNWARRLSACSQLDRIVLADIQPPTSPLPDRVEFCPYDVRQPIAGQAVALRRFLEPGSEPHQFDWLFNFAAVHREPGHEAHEYFDTNLPGARNVCEFAEAARCPNILFTSSIAVYGATSGPTSEDSPLYPTTPYGISKLAAELIHEGWQRAGSRRRLIVCRPGVVYGPGDPGNILRMIRAVNRGYFFFPGPTTLRKSYGYIEGLLDSFEFTMARSDPRLTYNYVEANTETIGDLVKIIRARLGRQAPVISAPVGLLVAIAHVIQALTGGKSAVHPARVRKAATPTHIAPQRLNDKGFRFRYDFVASLDHWRSVAPQDFE